MPCRLLIFFLFLGSALSVSAQLAYYVDAQGRRVYINGEDPRKPGAPAQAKRTKSHRSSVLVKVDPKTKALVEVPPPGEPVAAPETAREAAVPGAPAVSPRPVASHLDSLIEQTAERHAVDPNLVRAVIQAESNFNPQARSYKGAMGLMQLIPGTARRFGVRDAYDPVENVDGGVRYLKFLLEMFRGDVSLSVAAYNAGEAAVARHGGVPPFRETRDYVRRISTIYIPGPAPRSARSNRWGIVKYVDENGKVLFTNLEMP